MYINEEIITMYLISEKIHQSELLEAEATEVFIGACPVLNGTDTSKSLQSVVDILKELEDCNSPLPDSHVVVHRKRSASEFYDRYLIRKILNIQSTDPLTAVVKATADGGHDGQHEHTLLEELTHVFHLGSMVILSILVVEVIIITLCKLNVHLLLFVS